MTQPTPTQSNTPSGGHGATNAPLSAAIVTGFAAAAAMWIVGWVLHLPGVSAGFSVTTAAMAVALLLVTAGFTTRVTTGSAVIVGAAAGLISSLLNLKILGSALTVQADTLSELPAVVNQLQSNAAITLGVFIAGSIAIGALGGVASLVLPRPVAGVRTDTNTGELRPERDRWAGRFALVLLVSMVPLLGIGGSVTSAEAGLSVPEGVNAYGALPFLFPLSVMEQDPRIYVEHTHRLFGWFVGLTVIALAVMTWASSRRTAVKILATVLVLAIGGQGMLGIYRVTEGTEAAAAAADRMDHIWAMIHGISAQFVFGLAAVTFAVLNAPVLKSALSLPPTLQAAARKGATCAHIAAFLLVLQLLTGAATRHIGDTHAGWTHVGLSVFTAVLIAATGLVMLSHADASRLGRQFRGVGRLLVVAVGIQFAIGWAVLYFAPIGSRGTPAPDAAALATTEQVGLLAVLVPTIHQTTGALLIALTGIAISWTSRVKKQIRREAKAGGEAAGASSVALAGTTPAPAG